MGFFDEIKKKIGLNQETKSKTEQINEQRNDIKMELAVKLYQKGFSDEEVETVLAIIQNAENDIALIKRSLIGTNINPKGDPNKPLADGIEQIRKRQMEMKKEVDEAIMKFAKNHEYDI